MSTTPAFSSPALTRILAPVVGNFFSSFLEFLYEQCSLHITEKMPSSVKFGSRPRICLMRSNSSGVRPCFSTSSGVTGGSLVALVINLSLANALRVSICLLFANYFACLAHDLYRTVQRNQ